MTAVLLPLDGSRFAESVVPLALTVAGALNGDLHVVRVHELLALPTMDAITPIPMIDASFEEEARAAQRAELESTAADLQRSAHRPVHAALLDGSVVPALIEYARVNHIGMIICSTHGRSGFARAALGSVAEELARSAFIPVMLLHPAEGHPPAAPARFEHVLVPLDGSAMSELVLPHALALLTGARKVTLFRMVTPVTVDLAPTPMPIAMTDPTAIEAEMAAARDYLEGVAATLRPQGFDADVEVSANVSTPSSIEQVVNERKPDFIAMVTHGRSGFARFIMGSVAESLVAKLRIPLVVYHPPGN